MIDFSNFKAEGNTPIYQQILLYIKRGLVSGTVKDGDELPSRRALSVLLGINPNTAQKAFSMLEAEGLIASSHGVTSIVTAAPERVEKLREELIAADVINAASALKQSGLSLEQALALMAHYWGEA